MVNPIVANLKYECKAHNLTYNLHIGQIEAPDNGIKAWSIRPQKGHKEYLVMEVFNEINNLEVSLK